MTRVINVKVYLLLDIIRQILLGSSADRDLPSVNVHDVHVSVCAQWQNVVYRQQIFFAILFGNTKNHRERRCRQDKVNFNGKVLRVRKWQVSKVSYLPWNKISLFCSQSCIGAIGKNEMTSKSNGHNNCDKAVVTCISIEGFSEMKQIVFVNNRASNNLIISPIRNTSNSNSKFNCKKISWKPL